MCLCYSKWFHIPFPWTFYAPARGETFSWILPGEEVTCECHYMLINTKQYLILLFFDLCHSQEMASKLKNEISQQLLRLNVSNYSMALVKVCVFYLLTFHAAKLFFWDSLLSSHYQRSYAFEKPDVPAGEQYVLKINYPFKVVHFSFNSL